MSDQVGQWIQEGQKGDERSLAQLLTWLERHGAAAAFQRTELISPPHAAFRFGITGPPGAGKSTIVGQLIERLAAQGLRIGVLAVDPSSPFTKGAILGDRIRYSEHFNKPNVFIRSLGTRGSLGGLSASAYLMLRAFDACRFDVVLIETVGVGQTELEIMNVADTIAVVLVPESGDSIQAMKAGLMEIANIFVVNKADRPGAASMAAEIEASVAGDMASQQQVRVIQAVATQGQGVDELVAWLLQQNKKGLALSLRQSPKRLQEEARALLRDSWQHSMDQLVATVQSETALAKLLKSPLPKFN